MLEFDARVKDACIRIFSPGADTLISASTVNEIEGRSQRLATDPLPCTKSVLQSHSTFRCHSKQLTLFDYITKR